jgi:hypothetical protein
MTVSAIEALIKNYDAKKKDPIQEKHLRRCRSGLVESDQTTNEVRWFFLDHFEHFDEN